MTKPAERGTIGSRRQPERRRQPGRAPRRLTATRVARLAILVSASLAGMTSLTSAHGLPARAHAARTLNATDTAHLRYIRHSGAKLFEEGAATGTLPGSMRATADIGPTLTATFTIYTHGGTIEGHGTATPHASGVYESFAGSILVTGGTGRYAHAHGHAGFYGVFNRRTYALTVQTTGRLSY
jgi:hypothetical protein